MVENMTQDGAYENSRNEFGVSQMQKEIGVLRKQSMRLQRVSILHTRLASILDFSSMVEAFSVWLMPYVSHELIGYNNTTHNKTHYFCSSHGPRRRKAISFAEEIIASSSLGGAVVHRDGQFAHRWSFDICQNTGIFLVLKENQELEEEEIALINDSLDVLINSLKRGLEYEDLFEQASSDPLTGLGNRRYFDDRIHTMMDGAVRYHRPLCMVSLDLDYFKEVNDNLGHLAGDEVLCDVASALEGCVRSTDLLARMGGDEFIIILDDTTLASGRILAERLCKAVADLNIVVSESQKVGVSIGLTELEPGESLLDWLERTDDVLYHAKATGRGRVSFQ